MEETSYKIPELIISAAVLILGYLFIRYVALRVIRRFLKRHNIDEVFINFITIIANFLLLALLVIVTLTILGLDPTFLFASLAAIVVAVIATMNSWMQNVAAGLWMLFETPFKLNGLIEVSGKKGRVEKISLLTTTLRTADNLIISIPNNKITSDLIINYNARPNRRIKYKLVIEYSADLEKAKSILSEIITSDERVLKEPKASAFVSDLNETGVTLTAFAWTKRSDLGSVKKHLREQIKLRFDEAGIKFVHNQFVVRQAGK